MTGLSHTDHYLVLLTGNMNALPYLFDHENVTIQKPCPICVKKKPWPIINDHIKIRIKEFKLLHLYQGIQIRIKELIEKEKKRIKEFNLLCTNVTIQNLNQWMNALPYLYRFQITHIKIRINLISSFHCSSNSESVKKNAMTTQSNQYVVRHVQRQ